VNIIFSLTCGRARRLHRLAIWISLQAGLALCLIDGITAGSRQQKNYGEHGDQNYCGRDHHPPWSESING
jgi:hypothetical protein